MRYAIVFLLLVSIFGCYAVNLKSIVQGNDKFTVNTYKELVKISCKDNIIFSGISAEVILSLLANGARGTTRKQLLKGLNLPQNIKNINKAYTKITSGLNINKDAYNLKLANKIYLAPNFSIRSEFNDVAVNNYDAEVENLDFSKSVKAANLMNSWVEEKTNYTIKNLIGPQQLNGLTKLVLINALYFSGQWENPFSARKTTDKIFHSSSTESKKIPTMYTEAYAKYAYNEQLKAKFLELGFINGNISMTFVLPDEIDGLVAAEKNLGLYLASQELKYARVAITLPKFKIETEIDFKPILQSLGVRNIFEGADLTGISKEGDLKVSFVLQKAFINVNEDGVEAAAATAAALVQKSVPPSPQFTFDADHPFYFYIRDMNTGITLFSGRFVN
ncbi:antichymotrypsin-2-like [Diabrotica undecimpunctata]|uniref:antichymotrypsin-2-like n=1 Tax=Diabrotica undecimpunctata TaxID=50387 RepID=UPI003B6353DC